VRLEEPWSQKRAWQLGAAEGCTADPASGDLSHWLEASVVLAVSDMKKINSDTNNHPQQ